MAAIESLPAVTRCMAILVIAIFLGVISGQAHALLIGSSVTGGLFDPVSPGVFSTENLFDPVNGFVPPGFGNSTSTTATIPTEFGFLNGGGTVANPGIDSVTASFSDSTLVISQVINFQPLSGFRLVFTDPAFTNLLVSETSDSFGMGGLSESLAGDTLTLTVAPNCIIGVGCTGWPASQTADFSFSSSAAIPEPGSLVLFGPALVGLLTIRRRKPTYC
jgi:hypothetical protein